MNFNCVIRTGLIAVATMMSLSSFAQDLIARQAPIDKKLKAVDSLALQKQIRAEQAEYPSLNLYPSWNNEYVHNYGKDAIIPDEYTIDLRGFHMPTASTKITSPFGPRWRRMHYGLDVKVNIGDTIVAAFDGKVRIVKYERRGYGKYVVIRHDNGLETVYGHLSKQLVKENELVKAGEPIGLGGNTGRSTGSHLHFETRFLGIAINPIYLFDFPKQDIVADTYTFHKTKAMLRRRAGSHDIQVAGSDGIIRYHKVKNGDTLGRIAKLQGVSVNTLCKLNNLKRTTTLRIGQVLRCS
ncbi:MAG: peptidoglycan DD-metalloendopeptidase family protein [Mediterranea sp.]|jgi:murein DD-endopeptidase MepM/ murein hydrolase activator NlpD|nr:peptidoglycan DD-metalloendopeptidase family protein [Mediterranea sp.]